MIKANIPLKVVPALGLALWVGLAASIGWSDTARDYAVGPGDTLEVSVLGKPDLSGNVDVRAGGGIVLHLLGRIEAAGKTVSQIEEAILARADERFEGRLSVLVSVAEFRSVYILGEVEAPGSYPYRPGLNVMKALALAGGLPRTQEDAFLTGRVAQARRRAIEARSRLRYAEAEQKAVAAARAELAGGGESGDAAARPALSDQRELLGLQRTLAERSRAGEEQRAELAAKEAELFAERRDLIERQLTATEEQVSRIGDLVDRGLARREQYLDLQVDADALRSDGLEAAAFQARARQTAAEAENAIRMSKTRFREELLAKKIAADQRVTDARAELRASREYLREVAPRLAQGLQDQRETVFEIYRDGGASDPETAAPTTPLGPEDVLMIRTEPVTN